MLVGTSKRTRLGLGHFPSPRQSLFCSSPMRWALALSSRGDSPGLQAGADTAERHVTATGLDGKSSRPELVSQKSWES